MCPAGEPQSETKKKTIFLLCCAFGDYKSAHFAYLHSRKSAWSSQKQLSPLSSSMFFHLPSWFWFAPLTSDEISVRKRRVWSEKVSVESVEFCQLGVLAGAIPLSCPVPVYLKRRDYSCSCCQQRASFRLSPAALDDISWALPPPA